MRLDDWINKKIFNKKEAKLTRQELEDYQLKRINDLIKYTKENSTFYKELYKDIDKINSLEELQKIPVIKKKDILENGNKMVCVSQSDISRIVSLDTSGTTGRCKRVYFTEEDQNLTVDFFNQGLSLLVESGDRMLIMLPYERENGVGDLIKQSLINIKVEPILNGVLKSCKDTIKLMIDNHVNSIVGMPVDILALGRYIKHNNLNIKIKSILLSADIVNSTIINEIKNVYNCEVFNHFGMTESGLGGAVDCKYHNGMHIRENDLLIEIVNPITNENVKDGESGEILITTLTRKAMPLIRYATGDICAFITDNCRCNSVLKRLDNIKYRIDDRANISENIKININQLDEKLFQFKNLINYKVCVENINNKFQLNLELAFLQDNISISDEILANQIKESLLNIYRVKKSHDLNLLDINTKITYTNEWIPYYKGKRKIICEG